MKKFDKLIILLIGAIALFAGLRNWYFGKIEKEITVDGHQVSLLPCKSGIHDLFGNGVDSIAMCKCLLPKFYELIKDDPDKVDHFKEVGFFKLEGHQMIVRYHCSGIVFLATYWIQIIRSVSVSISKHPWLASLRVSLISQFNLILSNSGTL